jgi:MFS family permease
MIPRFRPIWSVLGAALRYRPLRRLEMSFGVFNAAEWAVWVSLLVYAYGHGGAAASGAMAIAQLVPSALLDPLIGVLIDRRRPGRVLFFSFLLHAAGMAGAAVAMAAGAPMVVVFVLAMVVNLGISVPRPAVAALLPGIVRTPEELTAANVLSGWMESAAILVAPAVAGALIGWGGTALSMAAMAGLSLVGAWLVHALPGPSPVARPAERPSAAVAGALRAVWGEPAARMLLGLIGAEFVLVGALDIFYVVLAISVLKLGQPGAGYLNAAFGAGAVVGSTATVFLVGARRLVPALTTGIMAAALALGLLGAYPSRVAAFLLIGAAGTGSMVFDVSARTLLQRTVGAEVLASAFALLESLMDVGLAIGSLLVPILVSTVGASAALVATGILFAVLVAVAWPRLRTVDAAATVPQVEIALLRSIPIFAPLPAPALEGVARALVPSVVPAGTVVVREGDPGEHYFAIADGEMVVSKAGRQVATLRRGEGFGEIALIHEVPRTATVTARTDCRLYALDKEPFVVALTGHPAAADEATTIASERLGRDGQEGGVS